MAISTAAATIPVTARAFSPHLLCIVPPYAVTVPSAAAAALLGYMKAAGHHEIDFLDLRLYVPDSYATTYAATSVWGDAFVIDVPDLPLVLRLLRSLEDGSPWLDATDPLFEEYCVERGINAGYLHQYLSALDRFLAATFAQLPDLEMVGFSVWNSNYLTTLMAARHLKQRPRPPFIVAGGPQVTESPSAAKLGLAGGLFDIVVRGEGEEAFRLIYEQYGRSGRLEEPVPGTLVCDRATRTFVAGPKRPLLRMATLPLPDFDKMDLAAYQKGNAHMRTLPFQLSRGCTDKCAFCTEWRFWEHYRPGGVDETLDQLAELKARYQVDGIAFTDSLLNGVMGRLQQFTDRLLLRDLGLKWGGYMRANMDPDTAAALRRSGYVLAFIGVESLADETLEAMNKRMTGAQNMRALEAFLGNGIAVRAGFIPGFPGDRRENFLTTARLLSKLQQKYPSLLALGIEPFVVSPGQLWYEKLAENGLTGIAWESRYLDIAPQYRDITDGMLCRVDGDNQGRERVGRYQIAVTVSQFGSNPGQTSRRRGSVREADFMYYSYEPDETESQSQLRFEYLERDWFVASYKTSHGTVRGFIVSADEQAAFARILSDDRLSRPWAFGNALLDNEEIRRFIETIEARHVVAMPSAVARLRPTAVAQHLTAGDIVALSPFLVARVDDHDDGRHVIALNIVNRRHVVLPHAAATLFADLSRQPLTLVALVERFGDESIPALERLVAIGALSRLSVAGKKSQPAATMPRVFALTEATPA